MLEPITPALAAVVTGYGLLSGASSLLQARRMRRRGTSGDVSLAFLSLYVAGYALWLLYGLAVGSLPLILVDAVGLACGGATLALAVRPVPLHRFPSRRRVRGAGRSSQSARRAASLGPPARIRPPAPPDTRSFR